LEKLDQWLELSVFSIESCLLFQIGETPNVIIPLEGIDETQGEV
jgi:hypothetical protein